LPASSGGYTLGKRLTEHIFPSSLPYQATVPQLAQHLVAAGTSTADAQHQALGVLQTIVQAQASILAYIDVFQDYALFAAVMVVVAFALRRIDLTAAPAAH